MSSHEEQEDYDNETYLRRVAIEVAAMLPHDLSRAFRVLRYTDELLRDFVARGKDDMGL